MEGVPYKMMFVNLVVVTCPSYLFKSHHRRKFALAKIVWNSDTHPPAHLAQKISPSYLGLCMRNLPFMCDLCSKKVKITFHIFFIYP